MRAVIRFGFRAFVLLTAAGLAACGDDDPSGPGVLPPTGVVANATSANSIRLTFSAAPNASGYVVDRATGASGTFARLTASPITATQYDDNGLIPTTQYRYRIAAVVAGDTSAFSTVATTTTLSIGNAGQAQLAGTISANRTLYADTTYTLNGYVKVLDGATLTIQPGTRILGGSTGPAGQGGVGGALFIYRGAKLVANGTADAPIVFTSSRAAGQRAPGDWGGIVIVGNASVNRSAGAVLTETPGPLFNDPANPNGTQEQYSNRTQDTDSSGALRYVRVEFAGFAVSTDNELNSFSFYAVGSRTKLEYLQALQGLDDAFEWFGGTVDGRYLVSYETGDDHFDFSEGYRGRNQYLIAFQSRVFQPNANGSAGGAATDPQLFEGDGCSGSGCPALFNSAPYTMPVFANFTAIGTGPASALPAGQGLPSGGGFGMVLRRGTGGTFVNGIIARTSNRAITIRDAETSDRVTADSLSFRNLYLAENVANFDAVGEDQAATVANRRYGQAARFAALAVDTANTGTAATSLFVGLPAAASVPATFDWTPAAAAPTQIRTGGLATFTGVMQARTQGFFGGALPATPFRGAADPSGTAKWWETWTRYAQN